MAKCPIGMCKEVIDQAVPPLVFAISIDLSEISDMFKLNEDGTYQIHVCRRCRAILIGKLQEWFYGEFTPLRKDEPLGDTHWKSYTATDGNGQKTECTRDDWLQSIVNQRFPQTVS